MSCFRFQLCVHQKFKTIPWQHPHSWLQSVSWALHPVLHFIRVEIWLVFTIMWHSVIISSGIFGFSLKMCLLVHRNHKNHHYSWAQVDMLRSLEQNVFCSNFQGHRCIKMIKISAQKQNKTHFIWKTFMLAWREHLWWSQVVFIFFNQHYLPSSLMLMHEEMNRLSSVQADYPPNPSPQLSR